MWLNHFAREEQSRSKRLRKIEDKHESAIGNIYYDDRKDKMRERFVTDGLGNSLINEMSGDPVQKVAKLKQKKRDKLKKYLYQGKNKGKYDYCKYKLQNGQGVSIEITPDYSFRKVLDPEKAIHNEEVMKQIKRNSLQK